MSFTLINRTGRELINRGLRTSNFGLRERGLVKGGRHGFKSTKVDDRKKKKTECLDRDIVCTLVSLFPFSKNLMILNLIVVPNTIMF